jgi:hypothetical protein
VPGDEARRLRGDRARGNGCPTPTRTGSSTPTTSNPAATRSPAGAC